MEVCPRRRADSLLDDWDRFPGSPPTRDHRDKEVAFSRRQRSSQDQSPSSDDETPPLPPDPSEMAETPGGVRLLP
jgi:hypothetical protein